jgi:hypothetical protein
VSKVEYVYVVSEVLSTSWDFDLGFSVCPNRDMGAQIEVRLSGG